MSAQPKQPECTPISVVAWVARLYRESSNKLDDYSRRLREGCEPKAALEFSRFVLWCGLTRLCCELARDNPKIDGALLQWKAEELQRDAIAWISRSGKRPELDVPQLEIINRKLDLIAARIAGPRLRCGDQSPTLPL